MTGSDTRIVGRWRTDKKALRKLFPDITEAMPASVVEEVLEAIADTELVFSSDHSLTIKMHGLGDAEQHGTWHISDGVISLSPSGVEEGTFTARFVEDKLILEGP